MMLLSDVNGSSVVIIVSWYVLMIYMDVVGDVCRLVVMVGSVVFVIVVLSVVSVMVSSMVDIVC